MAEIERLTITLPSDMAAVVKGAVEGGDYASSSEVVREALRDWKMKRALQLQELAALKADIDKGLVDVAEGRIQDFDAGRIIERGRKLLAARSPPVNRCRRGRPRRDLGLYRRRGFRGYGDALRRGDRGGVRTPAALSPFRSGTRPTGTRPAGDIPESLSANLLHAPGRRCRRHPCAARRARRGRAS